MTSAAFNLGEGAAFWRAARRLHPIYAELNRTFALGGGPCRNLESPVNTSEPEVVESIGLWFDHLDMRFHAWQLRQLLQSTSLQTEENLRALIFRYLDKPLRTGSDRDKIDFLLVQYFAHCAPDGLTDQITLDQVAQVLKPVLGTIPTAYSPWMVRLDEKLRQLNDPCTLAELEDSCALVEARERKLEAGDLYFEPALLVAFTRFNFQARRVFLRALHSDLRAIRAAVNELKRYGWSRLDCREAGMTENESLDRIRQLTNQWTTPFRAPYSGGAAFQPLTVLNTILARALRDARKVRGERIAALLNVRPVAAASIAADPVAEQAPILAETPVSAISAAAVDAEEQPAELNAAPIACPPSPSPVISTTRPEHELDNDDYLEGCIADIREQLLAQPPQHTPRVSTILLGGCKLLIATWEAEAFTRDEFGTDKTLQQAVAARTILHVHMDRNKKGEGTELGFATHIAHQQVAKLREQVAAAKEVNNIDAAVNLAATAKRLQALIEECEKGSA